MCATCSQTDINGEGWIGSFPPTVQTHALQIDQAPDIESDLLADCDFAITILQQPLPPDPALTSAVRAKGAKANVRGSTSPSFPARVGSARLGAAAPAATTTDKMVSDECAVDDGPIAGLLLVEEGCCNFADPLPQQPLTCLL